MANLEKKLREQFEAWAKEEFPDCPLDFEQCPCPKKEPFHYLHVETSHPYRAFKAGVSLGRAEALAMAEKLARIVKSTMALEEIQGGEIG